MEKCKIVRRPPPDAVAQRVIQVLEIPQPITGYDRDPVNVKALYRVAMAYVLAVHDSDSTQHEAVTLTALEDEFRNQGMIRPDEIVRIKLEQAQDSAGDPCHGIYVYEANAELVITPVGLKAITRLLFCYSVEDTTPVY